MNSPKTLGEWTTAKAANINTKKKNMLDFYKIYEEYKINIERNVNVKIVYWIVVY